MDNKVISSVVIALHHGDKQISPIFVTQRNAVIYLYCAIFFMAQRKPKHRLQATYTKVIYYYYLLLYY